MKSRLAGLLIGGSLDPNLEICHNLLHDLTESSGLSILPCSRKVNRRQGERLCRLRDLCCETRPGGRSPSRGDRLGNVYWRRRKRGECLCILRVRINGGKVLWPRDCGRICVRRERVWSTFKMVPSLQCDVSTNMSWQKRRTPTASAAASMMGSTSVR